MAPNFLLLVATMMTWAGAGGIAVWFVHPAVPTIAPARAVPDVTKPAHRAVHRRPASVAHVTTRVWAAVTRLVPRSARRAVAVVAPMAALESVRPPVLIVARLRRNKAVAAVVKDVPAAVTTPVLQAVVGAAPKRVVVHAALTA